MPSREGIRKMPVVYSLPGMEEVYVQKDIPYKVADGAELHTTIYIPKGMQSGSRLPAVIFIHGEGPTTMPIRPTETGQYTSWGRLAAASGMIGITFNHRISHQYTRLPDPASDIADLIHYVRTKLEGVDSERISIWACSAGGSYGLCAAIHDTPAYVRCIVSYYAVMDLLTYRDFIALDVPDEVLREYSPLTYLEQHPAPLLVVRAGLDKNINYSVDHFMSEALKQNAAIELINYPQGHHAFDVLDDTNTSRSLICRTLEFLKGHLLRDVS